MTIQSDLTESDYWALRRYTMFKYRKIQWVYIAMIILFSLASWYGEEPSKTTALKLCDLIVGLVLWSITTFIFLLIYILIIRLTSQRFRGTVGPHTFEIEGEVFTESHINGRIEIRIPGIRRIVETRNHFFIITSSGIGHVIPKRDQQDFEALRAMQKKVAGR